MLYLKLMCFFRKYLKLEYFSGKNNITRYYDENNYYVLKLNMPN